MFDSLPRHMPLEVAALAPLSVGTLAWRDASGDLQLTVIAKATYEIRPDRRARLVDPYPLFGDLYFEENVGRSLRVASDHAPAKARADVLFTGAAYAPVGERVTHRSVRFGVASGSKVLFDKKVLVVGSRERDRAGTPTPPQPFAYLPLRWEMAYGGAGSRANPIGIGEDPGDTRLPSIVDPSNPKRAAGLGPVPAHWHARAESLGGVDPAVFTRPVPTIAAGLDLAYFNAAPADQQLATLQGDESVLMSGLHPAIQEMTWRLPGLRAHAVLDVGGARRAVSLVADTLWIEGEMLRATLTWRGHVGLSADEATHLDTGRVTVTLAKADAAPTWERRTAAGPEPAPRIAAAAGLPETASIYQRSASIELELEHSIVMAPRSEKKQRLPRRVTPTLPIVNETGLVAWTIPWQVKPPEFSTVVIVKATYLVGDDGSLTLAPDQDPPSGDVPYDEDEATPGVSSLRYTTDFAVFKPAADVTLVGHGYPPDERVGVSNVELRVGDLRRRIGVFGDRKWGGFGIEGKPARFEKMPLRWERALGGPLSDANPVGRGFKTGVAAPNLERPEALVRLPDDRPAPACFAPISPQWKPRRERSGTFDMAWLKDRWPYLPADFDWGHFNAAPAEQQVPYLRGDERFAVVGVRPGGKGFEGQLPGARPRVFAQRTEEVGGDFFEVLLRLDTLQIDADAGKLVLVWRGLFATPDDDSPDIAALYVDVEQGAATRPVDEVRERFLARILSAELLPLAALAVPSKHADGPARPAAPLPPPPDAPSRDAALALIAAGPGAAKRDLTGVDLGGANLAGMDLRGVLLVGANLAGAVLDRARLAGAVLAGARADGASFVEADLAKADLTGARLGAARFDKASLAGALLDGVHAAGSSFVEARGERPSFVGATLDDAKFDGAKLLAADFTRATLTGARFAKATLDDVRLYEARCDGAVFDGAAMARARAERASMKRASFLGITGARSVWESADLTGAIFGDAQIPHALFARARLDEAVLARANAAGTSFQRASLRRARCARANLMQAIFERADLTEADLRGANLYQAETWRAKTAHVDLAGANVTRTKLAPRR
jgi:uncharacterized protein YjbI with pentapeptide repeats